MRKVGVIALILALLVSISGNVYMLTSRNADIPTLAPEDQKWAAKAISIEAARQKAPREAIERLDEVSVMHFPEEVCVALTPAWGVAGGSNVTCFESKAEKVTRQYDIGE